VTRAPGNGIKPGGSGINGLAIDLRGRVYAVGPGGCNGPGMVHVLTAPPDYREIHTVTVGSVRRPLPWRRLHSDVPRHHPRLVLQTYRYSETSKVVRLATRDLGVQSAIAKGALRPKSRFGAGLELLSEGMAQLYFRETRELHTLGAFDLVNLRRDLADDVGRFAGAAHSRK